LPDIAAIYPVWKRIVLDHRVQGVKVYDARLIAVMSVYAPASIRPDPESYLPSPAENMNPGAGVTQGIGILGRQPQ